MYSICCSFYGSVSQFDDDILWEKQSFKIVKIIGQTVKGFARNVLNLRLLPLGHRKRGYEE